MRSINRAYNPAEIEREPPLEDRNTHDESYNDKGFCIRATVQFTKLQKNITRLI
jgi:hypothetical protein